MAKKERFMGRGKNGNKLMGGHAHPVRCYDKSTGEAIRTFNSLKQAGEWLVHIGAAKTVNSAKVGITHAINGRQHYWGHDHLCSDVAFGLQWKNA